MKHRYLLLLQLLFSISLFGQNAIPLGKGSYAEYPPQSVWDEDGYFAKSYRWFHDNWSHLYLHANARTQPLPTNKWWTNYVFAQYGGDAWAYPHAVSASNEGITIKIPNGFQGGGMVIAPSLEIKGASQLRVTEEAEVFADFESTGYPAGWTVAANPAYPGPVGLSDINQSPAPNGFVGNRFVNSFKGDAAKLALTSPSFVISKKYIQLRVGGGNYPNDTYVGLFINGVRVLSETGANSGTLTARSWDVSAYAGQTAEIRIVDNSGGGWGFIMCDQIVFSNSSYTGTGYPADFAPLNSNVYSWSDLGFTFRSEDAAGRYMHVSLVHGVPFTYVELHQLVPILKPGATAKVYDMTGNEITLFPATVNACALEFGGRTFGLHLPAGSRIYRSKGEDYQIEIPDNAAKFIVVSALPSRALLATYDTYARNKPTDTHYEWDYQPTTGLVSTTFRVECQQLESGATDGGTLMSFLPHHYRNTTTNAQFIAGADYQVIKGKMHTAAGRSFTFEYPFTGMPPYLPEPLSLSENQKGRLRDLITARVNVSAGFNGNTYAKGLGEESNVMLMAKATDHPGFATMKQNLKNELQDWLTYSPSEANAKQYFFAKYPDYGALIGFAPGYGSQGFNDLHFHYGYFATGAARLMMVDPEFKRDYAEMVKLVVRSFANWKHYSAGDDYLPFLRTFDPYFGHSFAGGTGDGGGNNQESTSEAIHSWFGIYLLGVELNDAEITRLGAMGFLLESTAANEYWMDMNEENFPATYSHEYAGIVRTDNLAWATYFSGDPGWVLGIQAVPCDFFYNSYLGKNPTRMRSIWETMLTERTQGANPPSTTAAPFENIFGMGSYLGGYHLNMMNTFDPQRAALFTDSLYAKGGEWATDVNMTTQYYVANAILTYGKPAAGYHTSIASGAVYRNDKGELTYLLYNPTESDIDVKIYKEGNAIETVKVGARKYYNSRIAGAQKPSVAITSHKANDKLALNDRVTLSATASDKDGSVVSVEFFIGNQSVGTAYLEPFSVEAKPTLAGATQLKAVATDNDGNRSDLFAIPVEVSATQQSSYINRPWNIPADKIIAVQFDNGGPGVACHDNEPAIQGGNNLRADTGVETENSNGTDGNIAYTNAGEWFEYTVNVQTTGVYAFSLLMSSAGGGAMHVEMDGVDRTGVINLNKTGSWGLYKDTTVAYLPLKAGVQVMRIAIDRAGMNLSSYRFALTNRKMAPSVDAGADQVVLLPGESVVLNGTAQAYTGSTVVKYEWKQLDSNAPVLFSRNDAAATVVSGLRAGTYQFQLTATDDQQLSGTDAVVVVVKPGNYPPVANPGNSRTIPASVTQLWLDGSLSVDPDGTIAKYGWTQIDSNAPLTMVQSSLSDPKVSVSGFLPDRLYIFRLTVTDNLGLQSSENVRILVENPTAIPESGAAKTVVYPNPFNDKLIVRTGEKCSFKRLLVRSLTGGVCFERLLSDEPVVELNTSEWPKGYYLLTLSSDQCVFTQKLIK